MPGKPAARLTDMTAHGGTITGPGVPTVLIGKMPAATMGDMHVCPMVTPGTPPIPHVGGPITLGSTGVFIGKKPAARVGDMAVCVGPPSSIILGCFTVMIGEAGSGSQAGPAPAAAAAASTSVKGVKSVQALKPPEHKETKTENHFIDVLVQDKKNKPIGGLCYKLKDPDGVEMKGATTQNGKIHHEGYAKAGSYEVQIISMSNAKWSASKTELGKSVDLSVDLDGADDGESVAFYITGEIDDKRKVWFHTATAQVAGKKAKATWQIDEGHIKELMEGQIGELTGVTFLAVCQQAGAASGKLDVEAKHVYTFLDPKGKPVADTEMEIETKQGKLEKKKTDKDGKIDLGKGRVGAHRIGANKPSVSGAARGLAKRAVPLASKKRAYSTLKDAALAACDIAQKLTKEKIVEYGGWLYLSDETGDYSFTGPVTNHSREDVSPGPKPTGDVTIVGAYHTHTARTDRDNNQFSNGDNAFAASQIQVHPGFVIVLGCPNGSVIWYRPKEAQSSDDRMGTADREPGARGIWK